MPINNADFIDASAYLRVQEKRLLHTGDLERAADARDVGEALRMLSQNSDYDFSSLKNDAQYEDGLKSELRRVYELGYQLAKENRRVVDIAAAKYDFHNVKAAVKASLFPQRGAIPYIRVTDIKPEDIEAAVAGEDGKSQLPAHILKAIEAAREGFAAASNPQSIDIAADKAMFAHMLSLCGEVGIGFITDYLRMSIDFYNIKTLLRVRAMQKGTAFLADSLVEGGKTPPSYFVEHYAKTPAAMVPVFYYQYFGEAMRAGIDGYEKTGNLSKLEKLLDNLLIQHTKNAKYLAYGAEILFSYLISKENEIRQVRILVTCKQNQIGAEALRERLRDNYA